MRITARGFGLKRIGIMGLMCIYFTTKLLWDTVPYVFELTSIGIITYGTIGAFLKKTSKRTSLVIECLLLSLYICVNALFQDTGKQFKRAMYEYIFYIFIFWGTYYYGRKTRVENYSEVLLKTSMIVSTLSWIEYLSHQYILPNVIDYTNYTGFRSIVFSRTFLAHGMVLAFFSLIGIYMYLIQKKVKYLICGFFSFFTILSTGSRGPLVAASVGIYLMFFVYEVSLNKSFKKKITFMGLSFVALMIVWCLLMSNFQVGNITADYFLNRFRSILDWNNDDGNTGRIVIWKNSFDIFKQHFLFGIGPSQTGSWNPDGMYGVTESGILKRLCELGIFGTVIYYAFIFNVICKGIKNFRKNKNDVNMILYFGLFTAVFIDDIILQATEEIIVAFFMWYALAGIENFRNRQNLRCMR